MKERTLRHLLALRAFPTAAAALVLAASTTALAAEPAPAASADAPTFGSRGVVAIGSDANLLIQNQSSSGAGDVFILQVHPAVDYFVADHLSLGLEGTFDYTHQGGSPTLHSTEIGLGPRVGYDIPLSDQVSIWPRVGVTIADLSVSGGGSTSSSTPIWIEAYVPILWRPAPHFFVGFGPFLDVLTHDGSSTLYGGRFTLGGWV
jgi:hypothetical protein